MSIDTEIQGSPSSIESAATWLRQTLAPELDDAVDAFNGARRDADASWESEAGEEFSASMKTARTATEEFHEAAKTMATDLDAFAEKLRTCQSDMRTVRADARAAGLTVVGYTIQKPGPAPERPPETFTGTEAEVAAYNDRVEAYNAYIELLVAYNDAQGEAARIDRKYAAACRDLQDQYTIAEHAAWIVTVTDLLGKLGETAVGAQIARNRSKLHARAQDLLDEASRAIDDLQAHPERYTKRKWGFFTQVDEARLQADRLAIEGKLDEAEDLLRKGQGLDDARLPKFLSKGGKILGPLGLGLGIYVDVQEGESGTQAVVSQGGAALAGVAAAAGTGAAVGAAVGSVIPGAGTAVGAGVGLVVGAGVGIFADGAIDSLFENGPDVGEAFDAGVDALKDTGNTIKDGVSGAIGAVGGLFD